jgi:cardiolipin synthase
MEQMFLQDLQNTTEIVLTARKKVFTPRKPRRRRLRAKFDTLSSGRTAAGAVRLGNVVGAAISDRRILSPAEARIMFSAGLLLLALAVVGVLWPRWISVPLAVMAVWTAISLFIKGYELYREGKREEMELKESGKAEQVRSDA